ncbi:hypothetical protein [Dactylosporangium sp. CA-233914]|uniref:hypothetical protein n=1 Tax=Dactylosporangium sp. CA-233914 TaxID=3239934 RepID=UPI003D935741
MTESSSGVTRRPDGPPAGIVAAVALGLSIAAVVVPLALSRASFPTPASTAAQAADYLTGHPLASRLGALLTFGASAPIGIYAATVYARLLRLGVRVPGPNIAFFGGISASVLLATSGLLAWSLGEAATDVPAAVLHLLLDLVFALGGIGFVGGLGLLIAGIAVPGLIVRLIPRWLAWVGLVLAAASEVSFLGMLWPGFDVLLPIGRFVGLLWLAAVGFLLPRTRHDVPARQ